MPVDKYVKEDVMDNKVFLRTINDVAEAKRGVTLGEKLKVFFGKRRIKKTGAVMSFDVSKIIERFGYNADKAAYFNDFQITNFYFN